MGAGEAVPAGRRDAAGPHVEGEPRGPAEIVGDRTAAETTLMRRVARCDGEAAAELFERHGDALHRYLRGCGVPAEDAEDLTQEVFLRAIRRATTYAGRGSLEGWLLRIARTCRLDRARADAARLERERAWSEDRGTRAAGASAPGDRGPGARLAGLLSALEPADREVIVLARFLDFPAARVAEVLEITPGAARVRLHRALERLAERYRAVEAG